MRQQIIGAFIDGRLVLPDGSCSQGRQDKAEADLPVVVAPATFTPMSEMDEVLACIANVVMVTQHMNADDARRVRAFVGAAHSLLSSTTALDKPDQRAFEAALRDAAKRN